MITVLLTPSQVSRTEESGNQSPFTVSTSLPIRRVLSATGRRVPVQGRWRFGACASALQEIRHRQLCRVVDPCYQKGLFDNNYSVILINLSRRRLSLARHGLWRS